MTEELSQELVQLVAETGRLREARPGVRIEWPEEIRQKVLDLLSRGIRVHRLARETKISTWSIYQWQGKKRGDFSEVRVVPHRGSSNDRQGDGIILSTPRGYAARLSIGVLRLLLREGLI